MSVTGGRATAIDNLPGEMGSNHEIVNDILKEISTGNPTGNPTGSPEDGTQIFQRQTDGMITTPPETLAPTNQQDVDAMQAHHMQRPDAPEHMSQPPRSFENDTALPDDVSASGNMMPLPHCEAFTSNNQMEKVAAPRFNIVTFAKTVLLFMLVYMLFSLRYVKTLVGKIPTFSTEQGLSVIGTVVSAAVGGLIMASVQVYV